MSERKSISKKIRFEVFKRDSFTCQYCGRSAPDVVLQIDHIQPVAKNGDNEITNLITSCFDCNSGKRDRELSDDAVIQKRKAQLDALQERREQLEMMLDWQRGLIDLDQEQLNSAHELYKQLATGFHLSEFGLSELRKIIDKFGISEVLEGLRIVGKQYIQYGEDELATKESVDKAFYYLPRILSVRKTDKSKPWMRDLYYIRGILRKRVYYVNDTDAISWLKRAHGLGADIEELKEIALTCRNWTQWRTEMQDLIAVLEMHNEQAND